MHTDTHKNLLANCIHIQTKKTKRRIEYMQTTTKNGQKKKNKSEKKIRDGNEASQLMML